MAYPRRNGEPVYRSSSLDDVQGYDDLRMIWKYVRMSETGKTAPLTDETKEKIAKGLKRTISEGKSSRTRIVAASMALAIADGDWNRDVYRKPIKGIAGLARASRAKGKGFGSSGSGADGWNAEGQAECGDDGQVDG